jgi:hypothetical protein
MIQTKENPNKYLLRGQELLDNSGKTLYAVARDGDLNHSTILRWMNEPDSIKSFDILFGLLRGLGYTQDQIRVMPLGEVFDID